MHEATQRRPARGMLSVAFAATALLALLVFAPLASATPDPVASGTTTVKLDQKLVKELQQFGIKISDEDAQKITTVGQAVDYVSSHQ